MRKVIDRVPDGMGGFENVYEDAEIIVVLGTEYTLERAKPWEDAGLADCDGYCDDSIKKIVVSDDDRDGPGVKADIPYVRRKQIRHEIVHAFLFESGLAENSPWAQDEEIVDWIAMQGPKIYKAWQEAGAL